MAGSCYGHKHREETLAKFIARRLSEETKGKISATKLGCKFSEETRAGLVWSGLGWSGLVWSGLV